MKYIVVVVQMERDDLMILNSEKRNFKFIVWFT